MKRFSFILPLGEWQRWENAFPPPSYRKELSSIEGKKVVISYDLKFRPTGLDWYALDKLQRSYAAAIPSIRFNDFLEIEGDGWGATATAYRFRELRAFPMVEVVYPPIIRWASSKKTFRQAAVIYAKRLKYEGLLSYPSLMGALSTLNNRLTVEQRSKARTLKKLVIELIEESEKWKVKLSNEELKSFRSDLGKQRGEQLTAEKEDRIVAINEAIKTGKFTKPSGAINQVKLSAFLGVHRNTIRNLIPFVLAVIMVLLWIRPPTITPNPLSHIFFDEMEERRYIGVTI